MLDLITTEELAKRMGYSGATDAFRSWCTQMRITPVPGRRGVYDPVLVRRRLDEAQGLTEGTQEGAGGLVRQRRVRLGKD